MPNITAQPYAKRQVPTDPAKLPAWLGIEFGNIQRALPNGWAWPVLDGEVGVTDLQYSYGNVKRYGATGDGVTVDTTPIRNAVASVIALAPATLYFPPGTYLSDPIKVIGPNGVAGTLSSYTAGISIVGDGATLVNRAAGTAALVTGAMLNIKFLTRCLITGLRINGNRAAQATSGSTTNHGIAIISCDSVIIDGNRFVDLGRQPTSGIDWQGDGLYVKTASSNIVFRNNALRNWGRWAVACVAAVQNLVVTNNVGCIYTTDGTPRALGFFDLEVTDGEISRNVSVCGNVSNFATAVFVVTRPVATATNFNCYNLTVSNNTLIGCYTDDPATFRSDGWDSGVMLETTQRGVISGNMVQINGAASYCYQTIANALIKPSQLTFVGNTGISISGAAATSFDDTACIRPTTANNWIP